jgi:phage terminase large subunit GpA-like protein
MTPAPAPAAATATQARDAAAHAQALTAIARAMRPEPVLAVDEWAEANMIVPRDAARPGPYRIAHTPQARRPMQCLSPRHPAKRVVIRGASQMLKTQVALNFLCACAHRAPANMLVLEPTDGLAKRLSARVAKAIRDVPVLQTVFYPQRARDQRNTIAAKDYRGGTMYIVTAGSAANLAEIPARYVYVDEIDRLELSVDGEGDPVALAEARTTTFEHDRKILHTSSPATAGTSKIDALFEIGTQEVYLVPCPHCGEHFELLLEHFRYARDEDTHFMARAWFVCPHCGCEIDERHKTAMMRDHVLGGTAHWHPRATGDGETVSFHVSAFYAPAGSISWLTLAREHARAKERLDRGDPEGMQVFYNTRLALSYAHKLDDTTAQQLMARAALPARVVPEWALLVTQAVDTQHNRLEVQTHAWGPGLEHAVIDYQVLMGAPATPPDDPASVWRRLDDYRRTPWPHPSGVLIYASAYAIDSGGANTQDVYNYGGGRIAAGCLVVHGSSRPNRPIIASAPTKQDVDWQGHKRPEGVHLWTIGTDTAKDHLHNRLRLDSGPGAVHFNRALDLAWYEGLLAERPTLKRLPGGIYRRAWVKANNADRNEPLDLAVYNLAVAHHLGLHKWTPTDWARLRAKLIPQASTPDLFTQAPPAPPAPLPAPPVTTDSAATASPQHPPATATPPAPLAPPPPQPRTRRILNRGI